MSDALPTYAGVLARALGNPDAPIELAPLVVEAARKNDKRQAYMKFAVDDGWVKNLTGVKDFVDVYLVVRIPRENYVPPKPGGEILAPST